MKLILPGIDSIEAQHRLLSVWWGIAVVILVVALLLLTSG
jgi:hypothetical protein